MIRAGLFLTCMTHAASRSLRTCDDAEGQESYYSLRFRPPPVIYSVPGSGNTMVRLLIDAALGHNYHTGSIYLDKSIRETLPGEMLCHNNMPAIKAHPFMVIVPRGKRKKLKFLRNASFANIFDRWESQTKSNKCAQCIKEKFSSALVVTRNPIRAAFADFNRAMAKRKGDTHTERLTKLKFKPRRFEAFLKLFAQGIKDTYEQDYHRGLVEKLPAQNSLFVRFEDLISKHEKVRVSTLRKIIKFLVKDDSKVSDEQLVHAFEVAESEHRAGVSEGDLRFGDAFTPERRQEFWSIVRNSTAALGGYKPPISMELS